MSNMKLPPIVCNLLYLPIIFSLNKQTGCPGEMSKVNKFHLFLKFEHDDSQFFYGSSTTLSSTQPILNK